MKRLLLLITIMLSLDGLGAFASTSDLLHELDNLIAHRSDIIRKKEQDINTLKLQFQKAQGEKKYELANRLYEAYDGFNTDSATYYARKLCYYGESPYSSPQKLQYALICLARCLAVEGLYDKAENILVRMQGSVLTENRNLYYHTCTLLYIWKCDYTKLNELKTEYYNRSLLYRDSVLLVEKDPMWRTQEEALLLIDKNPVQAKNRLRSVLDRLPEQSPYTRYLANSLASLYNRLGQTDSTKYYYALSAIADIKAGVLEYASLNDLAMLLFKEGDVRRAYDYTNCCLEDAEYCGAQLRILKMGSRMPEIMDAYQNLVDSQHERLVWGIIGLIVLLLFTALIAFMLYRIKHRLQESRRQTEEANVSLRDSIRIKENYVIQYMKQCSQGIQALEDYRMQMLKVAHSGNIDKVMQTLRNTDKVEREQKKFVEDFDRSFVALFPTFVSDFNALLRPEEQIVVPEGKLLTTELRIFALIRLGVTESEDIASFLGYSLKTIYNYRTRVRNKALGNRDSLEKELLNIGI